MTAVLEFLSPGVRSALRRAAQPEWTPPMLATLTYDPFSDANWVYERKLDGVRCLAFHDGAETRLLSRNRKDQSGSYPELVEAVAEVDAGRFIVDGEVVAFEGGVTSFSRLQGRMQIRDPVRARATGIAVYYYLFDLLHYDGYDTTRLPLRERKSLLHRALTFRDPLRFTSHRNERGEVWRRRAERGGRG